MSRFVFCICKFKIFKLQKSWGVHGGEGLRLEWRVKCMGGGFNIWLIKTNAEESLN